MPHFRFGQKGKPLFYYDDLHFFFPVGNHLDEKKRTTPVAGKEKSIGSTKNIAAQAALLIRDFWQACPPARRI
ncbi:MAG: hypothetical protein AAFQ94_26610 [Bacteroidota bacterium]